MAAGRAKASKTAGKPKKAPAKKAAPKAKPVPKRKAPAKKKPPAKRAPAKKKPAPKKPTAAQLLARLRKSAVVISVHGAFGYRAAVDIDSNVLADVLGVSLSEKRSRTVTAGVARDLAEQKDRSADVEKSGLAATAVQLAREIDNPYNSATSKAQCAKSLMETMDQIRELVPEEEEEDGLANLAAQRAKRLEAA